MDSRPAAACPAAIQAIGRLRPGQIVVAVRPAPESTCRDLAMIAEDVVWATTPTPFSPSALPIWDFNQTTDVEVRDLLAAAQTTVPDAVRLRRPRHRRSVPRLCR